MSHTLELPVMWRSGKRGVLMRSPWHTRLGLFLLVVLSGSLVLLVSVRSAAQATSLGIALSPNVGPPTTVTKVHGTGFKSSELVSIDFGMKLMTVLTASTSGAFSVTLPIPKSAQPGNHIIQAIGQTSGRSAQATFLVQTDWAQFHFRSNHAGYNPYENVLTPSNVSALALDWSYTTGSSIESSPAVANGVVYVGSDDYKLYALDAVTGVSKWIYPTGYLILSTPVVSNGVVYFGSLDHNLYALDAATGVLKWSYDAKDQISCSPTIVNGLVYFDAGDRMYALDAATGMAKWIYSMGSYGIKDSPTVSNGIVYMTSPTALIALDATTGSLLWSTAMNSQSTPTVVGGVVYIGSNVYQGSSSGRLNALDAATGSIKWQYKTAGVIASSTALYNGVVYVGSDKKLYALDAVTGTLKWSYTAGMPIFWSSPAVANGVVYVGSLDYKLYALDATTGSLKWSYTTGNEVESSPAVVNGVVYVGSDDGNVYAFHLPGMSS